MKLAFVGVSIYANTGYGRMTREITSRLIEKYDVLAIGQEDTHVWGSDLSYRTPTGKVVPNLPIGDPFSSGGLLREYCNEYGVDVLVGHWDVWVLGMLKKPGRPYCLYVPIDAPLTPRWMKHMEGATKIIAYSLFGLSELAKYFPGSQVTYIPHGVDCATFKPLEKSKAELRKNPPVKLNAPIPEDAFLMMTAQANVGPRKQLPLLLKTFRRFAQRHENAHLYLHSNAQSDSPQGYDLVDLCDQFGINDRVHFPKITPIIVPATDEQLNELFNAADVYVSNSLGEGFGLPVLESMAAGVPAIAPANSSHVELVKSRGWLCDCVPTDIYADYPVYVPTLQEFPIPNQRSMLEKMEEAYAADRGPIGSSAREFALGYDWSKVMPKWFRLFDELGEEIQLFKETRASLEVGPGQVPPTKA